MTEQPFISYDVVVVGGGLAGLAAARRLAEKKKKVLLLEARDRWGGRVCTDFRPNGTHVELGATWVGPGQDVILDLLRELNIGTVPTYNSGKNVQFLSGKVATYSGTIPPLGAIALIDLHFAMTKIDRIAATVNVDEPMKTERAEYYDSITADAFLKSMLWTNSATSTIDILMKVVCAMEATQLSALWFLRYVKVAGGIMKLADIEGGAQQDVIEGGSSSLPDRMAGSLKSDYSKYATLRLNEKVRSIEQFDNYVCVTSAKAIYSTRYCIVTLPPTLAARIEFVPPLPAEKDQLFQAWAMGSVIKTVAIYDRPYWREAGFSGQLVSDDPTLPVSYAIDHCDGDKLYALIGFVNARNSHEWRRKTKQERQAAITQQYSKLLGLAKLAHPIDYVEKDWASDEYSRGCYVGNLPPSALTHFAPSLRSPFQRVHFAGAECAKKWTGYMDGALRSGFETAEEISSLL